jgi:hypothetical protein
LPEKSGDSTRRAESGAETGGVPEMDSGSGDYHCMGEGDFAEINTPGNRECSFIVKSGTNKGSNNCFL